MKVPAAHEGVEAMVAMMNLAALTDKQLKIYLSNCKRLGETERARAAASALFSRGIANAADLKVFQWNQDSVRSKMQRFKKKASAVKGNKRTAYTEAGGLKIGRPKGHPDKKWINTYCAIKTPAINAIFACSVKTPGEEPEFELQVDDTRVGSYGAHQLDSAFEEWSEIARRAQGQPMRMPAVISAGK
jgi:hypothetical protein